MRRSARLSTSEGMLANALEDLEKDLDRTFPGHRLFNGEGARSRGAAGSGAAAGESQKDAAGSGKGARKQFLSQNVPPRVRKITWPESDNSPFAWRSGRGAIYSNRHLNPCAAGRRHHVTG